MTLVPDILEKWLDEKLDLSINILSASYDLTSDKTTLNVDNPLHLRGKLTFTDGGNTYTVLSSDAKNKQLVVSGDQTVLVGKTVLAANPFYFHGTPKMITAEISGMRGKDKYPMVYLVERFGQRRGDIMSPFSVIADIRLFVLDSSDRAAWTTDKHYKQRLEGLFLLANRIIDSLQKEVTYFYTEETEFQVPAMVNFGEFVELQGNERKLMLDDVDAIEIAFTLNVYKNCNN